MPPPNPIANSDSLRWSASLGKWKGIPVLLHGYFMAVLVLLLIIAASSGEANRVEVVLMGFAIWVASSILHEISHLYVCHQLGGFCQLLIFSPLGGQSIFTVRGGPSRTMLVYIAGPIANLCVALTALLFLWSPDVRELLNPFEPRTLTNGSNEIISLKLLFFLNWFIFLANLLPVFPLDGGHVLAEAIRVEPASSRGPDLATEFVGRWSVLASAGAFLAAFWQFALGPYWHIPTWVVSASFGAYFFFGARESLARCQVTRRRITPQQSERLSRGEDLADAESLDAARVDRWLRERQKKETQWNSTVEVADGDEELRVDRVLEALHEKGFEGLSIEDRELLRRASQRYRERLKRSPVDRDED
jgi:Zn-dependent protease